MPKSKYAPALFEVIQAKQTQKSPSKFQLPKWWRNNILTPIPDADDPGQPVTETTPATCTEEPEPSPVLVSASPTEQQSSTRTSNYRDEVAREPLESFMRISVGDKTLVMSTVGATVVMGVFVVILCVTFGLGSMWGASGSGERTASLGGGSDEVEQALLQTPKPEVLKLPPSVASGKPRSEGTAKPAETARAASPKPVIAPPAVKTPPPIAAAESAKKPEAVTRVVLETFAGEHKASAEFAQKWLQSRKINTLLEKRGSHWRLVSAGGFDNGSEDTQRAQAFVDDVKAQGKAMSSDMVRAGLPNYLMTKPALERMSNSSP